METLVKHEPQEDLGDPSVTSNMLITNGSSVMASIRLRPQQEDLSSHQQHDDSVQDRQRDQQVVTAANKLQMMQTDDDPLLQETINALISGSGDIETVPSGGVTAMVATNPEIDNGRNYECNFCGKMFTRSNTLSYHLKIHNDEKPYKCESCDKAFREQYRLTKHQKMHVRDLSSESMSPHVDQEAEQSQDSNFPSNSRQTLEEEDYTTGDSDRFFRNYEMHEHTAVMKLEPDISLTVDGGSNNTGTQSSNSDNDMRYQIIEERIKSLQREVHLVNQNLNRVETKLDGLTKIMAMFISKFDEVETQQTTVPNNSNAVIPIPLISMPIDNLQGVQPPQPTITVNISQPQEQVSPTAPQIVAQTPQPIRMITTQNPVVPMTTVTTVQPSLSIPQHQHSMQQQQQQQQQFIGGLQVVTAANQGSPTLLQHSNDTFPDMPELPLRTVNDFLDLNDHCTDNEQFLLQMMIRLHQEVDNSQPHQRNIKKMMEALVTYEVLCQFSWSGKSAINGQYTKYVFGNSVGIIDLLTKTLNLGRSAEEAEANQKPIFTAIQSFIKHSRQNMLRDSRKRRDSGGGHASVGGYNKWDMGAAVHCGVDRLLKPFVPLAQQQPPQLIKLEKQDIVNSQQFYD